MILQPVFSIFPCSPLPSGTCWTPGLSVPWHWTARKVASYTFVCHTFECLCSPTFMQVLLTTEASSQQCSMAAWDLGTGSCISTRKGLAVAARCLCLRANHTLIGASQAKPVLQLWPLSKKVYTSMEDLIWKYRTLYCKGKMPPFFIVCFWSKHWPHFSFQYSHQLLLLLMYTKCQMWDQS